MKKFWSVLLLLVGVAAHAASFDCAKATTRQEKAICASPKLSAVDDQMAAVYKADLAQLPVEIAAGVRDDQRAWLRTVALTCPARAKTTVAALNECLSTYYEQRILQLKGLILRKGDVTFITQSIEQSLKDKPDPDGPDPAGCNEEIPGSSAFDASWPHAISDAPEWKAWNSAIEAEVRKSYLVTPGKVEDGPDSDDELTISVNSVGKQIVTASFDDSVMGHCAAHPTDEVTQFNWLLKEQRELQAKDVFRDGSGWEKALSARVIAQLRKDKVDFPEDGHKALPGFVADPHNWTLDAKGLTFVFSDGEVFIHADIPDPVTVPWTELKAYLQTDFEQPQ